MDGYISKIDLDLFYKIRGNTLHRSGVNKSNYSRGLYACVYCADKIDFLNFYKDKFVI